MEFFPFFLSRAILYSVFLHSGLENLELKYLARGKDRTKTPCYACIGGRVKTGIPCFLSL